MTVPTIPTSYGGNVISSTTDQVNSGFLVSQELIDYLNVGSLFPPGFVVTRQVTFTFTKAGTPLLDPCTPMQTWVKVSVGLGRGPVNGTLVPVQRFLYLCWRFSTTTGISRSVLVS
jgi:hypothetical protein